MNIVKDFLHKVKDNSSKTTAIKKNNNIWTKCKKIIIIK